MHAWKRVVCVFSFFALFVARFSLSQSSRLAVYVSITSTTMYKEYVAAAFLSLFIARRLISIQSSYIVLFKYNNNNTTTVSRPRFAKYSHAGAAI